MEKLFEGCRGCPRENGTLFLTMDGCFTSGRMASSGAGQSQKYHNHYFIRSEELIETAQSATSTAEQSLFDYECPSVFEAMKENEEGGGRRPKFKNLSETGHFALACARHEVFISLLDMYSGEKFEYPDLLLKQYFAQSECKADSIHLYYDIMCRYKPHIERLHILPEGTNIKFLIGQFHVLPHGSDCNQKMQPYITPGNGEVDGEALERRWAFFRNHHSVWKNMTAQHRAIFIERLVWWQVRMQSKQLAKRAIGKHDSCVDRLFCLGLIPEEEISMNHNDGDLFQGLPTSSSKMAEIIQLAKEFNLHSLFLVQKAFNQWDELI